MKQNRMSHNVDEHENNVHASLVCGVLTLRMNRPKSLNGWTDGMMRALTNALSIAARDDAVHAVILTGTGTYYCAGVNLGSTIRLGHPRTLYRLIVEHNESLFRAFIDFPKPILAAINGHAIGAAVTSAALCDGIIASDRATFSTPFHRLGLCPEGCSSVQFEALMGKRNAERMLDAENWRPNAHQALEAGLVQWVTSEEKLLSEAQRICEDWIHEKRRRVPLAGTPIAQLHSVNAAESRKLAECFLSSAFLKGQFNFLWHKNKKRPALLFGLLWITQPIWSRLR